MRKRRWLGPSAFVFVLAACAVGARPGPPAPMPDRIDVAKPPALSSPFVRETIEADMRAIGELLYQERCATCHDSGRAPPRNKIAANTPEEILEALDTGFMAAVALFMTSDQKIILARHLSQTD